MLSVLYWNFTLGVGRRNCILSRVSDWRSSSVPIGPPLCTLSQEFAPSIDRGPHIPLSRLYMTIACLAEFKQRLLPPIECVYVCSRVGKPGLLGMLSNGGGRGSFGGSSKVQNRFLGLIEIVNKAGF